MSPSRVRVWALLLFLAALSAAARAIAVPPSRPAKVRTPAEALTFVSWDAERRGALLLVADPPGAGPPVAPLPLSRSGTLVLRKVAARWDRKVVSFGSVTALAPTRMTLLDVPAAGKPDLTAGLDHDQQFLLLLSTLTPDQWGKIGGAGGLGASDLGPEQRPVFFSLVPQPLRLRETPPDEPASGPPITLTPEQRATARLRLNRSAEFLLSSTDPNQPGTSAGLLFGPRTPARFFLDRTPDYHLPPDRFGRTLRRTVPNRPKPGDLAFDAPALQSFVPLNGAETLGDLVVRVGKATGIELYADPRVGKLPIWVRGTRARAADLLRALCCCVTGAFRPIRAPNGETVFVLSHDREGLGTLYLRLADWLGGASAQQDEWLRGLWGRVERSRPHDYIGYAPDDPYPLAPDVWRRWKENRFETFPVADLTPAQQEAIAEAARHYRGDAPLRTDVVRISMRQRLFLLLPGGVSVPFFVGESDLWWRVLAGPPPAPPTADDAPPPHVVLPVHLRSRALCVAPRNADEARRVVAAAARAGLNQVWVAVGLFAAPDEPRTLAAAIAEGKARNVSVVAVVRLLHTGRPPDAPKDEAALLPDALRDRSLRGETGAVHAARWAAGAARDPFAVAGRADPFVQIRDWLRVDAPGVVPLLKRRLLELAGGTPGLAGLALRDTAAPGYADPGIGFPVRASRAENDDFGYTPALRLAFLRRAGADPVDLLVFPRPYGADLGLPFFGSLSYEKGAMPWNALRHAANRDLLAELYAALRAARPGLPLLIQERSNALRGRWYGTWDRPGALPRVDPNDARGATGTAAARSFSKRVLLNVAYHPAAALNAQGDAVAAFARFVNAAMERNGADWDGMVLDLSAVPADVALPLLNALVPAAGTNDRPAASR